MALVLSALSIGPSSRSQILDAGGVVRANPGLHIFVEGSAS
jgi:hypothetical protein